MMKHPLVRGAIGVAIFIVVAEVFVFLTMPAWAGLSIPITDKFTIELGELPQWIIALVAAGGLWKAWKAEKRASEAAAAAILAAAAIEQVRHQTDGMISDIKALAKAEGKHEGKAQAHAEVADAKAVARADKIADAKTAEEVCIVENNAPTKPV